MPARIVQVPEIPRTKSGKIVELAVRDVIHGREVKNREALANPEALEHFRDRAGAARLSRLCTAELRPRQTPAEAVVEDSDQPPRRVCLSARGSGYARVIEAPDTDMTAMDHAVILSACRTPIGSFGGAFKDLSAADLGAIVIREAIARAGVDAADIGDVIMGCVLQAGAGMNVARQAAIKAGVPVEVPAETINRVCGSGLQAVVHAVEAVKAGYVDLVLAGGTESMSNAPYLLKGARWGYRMGNAEVVDSMLHEGLTCAIEGCHMGMTAEEVGAALRRLARGPGRVRRREPAARRGRRAVRRVRSRDRAGRGAAAQGPPLRVTQDEYPRAGTTAEKLAALKPAFAKDGTVTAGNASGINDGAAALVVATEQKAQRAGTHSRSRASCRTARPASTRRSWAWDRSPAMRKAADRAGLSLGRPRSLRAERSLRLAVARGRPRARPRSARRSTSTAARSRSAIRSAPAARASSPRWCTRCRRAAAGAARRRCASAAGWAPR